MEGLACRGRRVARRMARVGEVGVRPETPRRRHGGVQIARRRCHDDDRSREQMCDEDKTGGRKMGRGGFESCGWRLFPMTSGSSVDDLWVSVLDLTRDLAWGYN